MSEKVCFVIVLITAITGCIAMKKIEPGNKWFSKYAFGIVALVSLVLMIS